MSALCSYVSRAMSPGVRCRGRFGGGIHPQKKNITSVGPLGGFLLLECIYPTYIYILCKHM